jgi:hypothetical protein
MIKLKSIRVPKYAKSSFTEWHIVNRENHQLVGFIRFTSSSNDYRYTAYVKDDNNPSSHLLGSSLSQANALTLIRNYYKAQEQSDYEIEQANLLNELEYNR